MESSSFTTTSRGLTSSNRSTMTASMVPSALAGRGDVEALAAEGRAADFQKPGYAQDLLHGHYRLTASRTICASSVVSLAMKSASPILSVQAGFSGVPAVMRQRPCGRSVQGGRTP